MIPGDGLGDCAGIDCPGCFHCLLKPQFLWKRPRFEANAAMMGELARIKTAIQPHETLLVVDAMTGQEAANLTRTFHDQIGITGAILTKLDGDTRGGAALSVRRISGQPIKFIGVGEKVDALQPFYPDRMASRILGMGDVLSLIEDAQKNVDHDEARKLAEKFKKGKDFDLEDFKSQLQQMQKMGGMSALMDKLPTQLGQMAQGNPALQEKKLKRTEGIINSMTPAERRKPELIKATRKRRIAAEAGVQVQEVNTLLKEFEQMQKMMKMMKGGGLAKMMKGMKGMLPGMR